MKNWRPEFKQQGDVAGKVRILERVKVKFGPGQRSCVKSGDGGGGDERHHGKYFCDICTATICG